MANSLWPWACSTSARQASATGSFGTAFSTVSASRVSAFQWRPVMVAPAGMAAVLARALATSACKRWCACARLMRWPPPRPPPGRGGLAPGVGQAGQPIVQALRRGLGVIRVLAPGQPQQPHRAQALAEMVVEEVLAHQRRALDLGAQSQAQAVQRLPVGGQRAGNAQI